jgi:excisionase family DNA binding protein
MAPTRSALSAADVDRMKPAAKLELMADLVNRVQAIEEKFDALASALAGPAVQVTPVPRPDDAPGAPKRMPFLTMKEVAELMRLSLSTVYGRAAAGTLPFPVLRLSPRRIVVARVEIERALGLESGSS